MVSLAPDQIKSFVSDGYLVLKNVVPLSVAKRARRTFFRALGAAPGAKQVSSAWRRLAGHSDILALVANRNEIRSLVEDTIGDPIRGFQYAQIATQFPTEPSSRITESGYPDCDIPFHGWHGHLDGLWNGARAPHQDTGRAMSEKELQAWNQDPGTNGVKRTYPGTGANLTNFTALLGFPLSNQSREGVGNLGLLRGAHHHVEKFFRFQRDQGGPLGPDGPGWERIHTEAPNGCGLRHYPEQVREQFQDSALCTNDGRSWPKPDFIRMELGDAVLTQYAVPHGATRCEADEPRIMAYFRLTSDNRPDHLKSNFVDSLTDNWLEWKGIQDVAREIISAAS